MINVPLVIIGLLKIVLGLAIILLSLSWYTDWVLRNTENPYEWEKRMKKIFCDQDPKSTEKVVET